MDKTTLRIISKVGLLLVVIGFFMPVSCNVSGFEYTKGFLTNTNFTDLSLSGFMGLIMFLASFIGVIFMAILISGKEISPSYDWIVTLISIISGLIAFIQLRGYLKNSFQRGGYFIVIGLIISLICMIKSNSYTE